MSLQSALARFGFAASSANGTYSPTRQQNLARLMPAELPPRALYDFLKQAYLTNGLYDGVRDAWAATGYASPNLKAIRNPVAAVVDILGAKLYPEPLTVTTPRTQGLTSQVERAEAEANDPVKAAVDQIHLWSNWGRAKRKHARWVSLYGEAFIKVVSDPPAGRVYFELIEPQYVTDYSIDVRDFVTSCRLDIPQTTVTRAGTEYWTHTELWDKDTQSVRVWRTEGDYAAVANRHTDDLGAPIDELPLSTWGIDFVPLCRAPFREIDDGRAIGAIQPAIEAIIESDLSTTNLHGTVFSELAGAKVLKAVGLDAAGRPLPAPVVPNAEPRYDALGRQVGGPGTQTDGTVTVGRREFWRLPGNMELEDVIPDINYLAALEINREHWRYLEVRLPALSYARLSELTGGDLSGKAITYKMRAFVDQVEEGRSNVLACLTQADMMALTMGAFIGLFPGIGTFEAGDYAHDFEDTPILHISSLDEAEEQRARGQAAQAYAAAGIPMSVILTDTLEMSEEEATEIVDEAAEEAEAAFEQQQALAAAQPAQGDDGNAV